MRRARRPSRLRTTSRAAYAARRPAPAAPSSFGHGDLSASLVLVFPLLLAYAIGVLFTGRVNGVDLVTRTLYELCGSRGAYLLVYSLLAAAFLIWIRHTHRWATLRMSIAGPVILESAVYALTLGAVVSLVVDRLLGLGSLANSLVSALGAGVHEELVFRLGLVGGCMYVLRNVPRALAVIIALTISSIAFAAAHHLGAHGEPFSSHVFAFRCVAGAIFGSIFWFRSLAHAVYAHVLYDILVATLG